MSGLRPAAGGVQRRDSTAPSEPVEKLHRAYTDLRQEAGEFVERLCQRLGTKHVAGEVDRGYTCVRQWVTDPERLPLTKLPELLELADPADPFLARFTAALGYTL